MVRLRWEWFRSPEYQASFFARTLMLTHVPKKLQSDAALHQLLNSIGMPYPTTEVHIGRVVGALPDLIEKHEEMVRKLERVAAGDEAEGWAVRLDGIPEPIAVSRRQLASVREALKEAP